MRCPKCHYISFESADRCRNCGYEFSLASAPRSDNAELPLNNREEDPRAPVDLSLDRVDGLDEPREEDGTKSSGFDIDHLLASGDLPLFKGNTASRRPAPLRAVEKTEKTDRADEPLVKPGAVARGPIVVHRPAPDVPRVRSRYSGAEVPRLDLDGEPDLESVEAAEPAVAPASLRTIPAPPVRRILAALIDVLIVNGLNAGVLYFTLKLCDLPLSIAGLLSVPLVPFVGFLLLLDAGYFVSFTTVVGQTIGKMATGLRVVHLDEAGQDEGQPNFGFATLRTAAYGASILPLGLGFLPALLGRDRRALHDRLAETRVVFSGKLMV